jgi:hypothetical protein
LNSIEFFVISTYFSIVSTSISATTVQLGMFAFFYGTLHLATYVFLTSR